MGNIAIAEELAGSAELDELYKLDASESGPEDNGLALRIYLVSLPFRGT